VTCIEQCLLVPKAVASSAMQTADGDALAAVTQLLSRDETVEFAEDVLGEEVGAVLEGRVDIVAAHEHYVLSEGEAILIPPNEPRRYKCVSDRCVLYRVTVRDAADQEPRP
jgi:mannose-6-phosphate isomerase-like protein (cupin superfamily)